MAGAGGTMSRAEAAWRARCALPALVSAAGLVSADDDPEGLWALDADHPVCVGCGAGWGLFSRRHHCRLCGLVFCGKCSANTVTTGPKALHRVCDGCCNAVAARKAKEAAEEAGAGATH